MRLLLTVFLVAVVLSGESCRNAPKPPMSAEQALADTAEQIIFRGHTLMTDRGVKRGEMFSDTIFVFSDQTHFVLRRVRATFNTETGAPNGTLKGDRGVYDLRTQILEGFGNVVVTSSKGERLSSQQLKYAQASNAISSDSAYTLVRSDKTTSTGIGFTSDPNLNSFHCLRSCGGSALVPLQGISRP
jgi:LPS export ABC transporter protein LptC